MALRWNQYNFFQVLLRFADFNISTFANVHLLFLGEGLCDLYWEAKEWKDF